MRVQMTPRRWLLGAGAGTLLLVGGLAAGPVASLAQGDPQAQLGEEEAIQIAIGQFPGTSASDVQLEEEDGVPVYEVTLSNGFEVEVDGDNGAVLETEQDDDDNGNVDDEDDAETGDDDDGENEEQEESVPAGTLDDGQELLPQATITLEQAVSAAQAAADGDVGEVDLEYAGDRLVFNVDIGEQDVKVDAHDGTIVSSDSDD